MAQLADCLVFNLADTLARDAEDLTDLLQRVRSAVIHAEAHLEHVCLALGQRAENLGKRLRQQRVGCCVGRTRPVYGPMYISPHGISRKVL